MLDIFMAALAASTTTAFLMFLVFEAIWITKCNVAIKIEIRLNKDQREKISSFFQILTASFIAFIGWYQTSATGVIEGRLDFLMLLSSTAFICSALLSVLLMKDESSAFSIKIDFNKN